MVQAASITSSLTILCPRSGQERLGCKLWGALCRIVRYIDSPQGNILITKKILEIQEGSALIVQIESSAQHGKLSLLCNAWNTQGPS